MQKIDDMPPEFFKGKSITEEMDKRLKEELDKKNSDEESITTVKRKFYKSESEFLDALNRYSHKPK